MSKLKDREAFESELAFHQREWRLQRIGWGLLALFLLLALGGLFGDGPLSHSRDASAAGSVEYERFVRDGLATELIVTPASAAGSSVQSADTAATRDGAEHSADAVDSAADSASSRLAAPALNGVHRVAISMSYLEAFRVEHITPEPAAVRMSGGRLVYEFASAAPGASISFHLHPQRLGRHTAEVRIDGGAPLAIRQFAYP
jgi:hypothetical protein